MVPVPVTVPAHDEGATGPSPLSSQVGVNLPQKHPRHRSRNQIGHGAGQFPRDIPLTEFVEELPDRHNTGILPDCRKVFHVAGNQKICVRCLGAFKKNIVVRIEAA